MEKSMLYGIFVELASLYKFGPFNVIRNTIQLSNVNFKIDFVRFENTYDSLICPIRAPHHTISHAGLVGVSNGGKSH